MAALHAACFAFPRPWSAAEFAALLADPLVFVQTLPGGFVMGRAVAGEAELLTVAVAPDQVAESAVAIMRDRKITCLFVVEPDGDGRATGILNIHDCLRAGVV